jgi:hypothetical protein
MRVATVALTAAGLLLIGASSTIAASNQNLFNATFSGSASFDGSSTSTFVGSGSATRLGRITTNGQALIDWSKPTPCQGGIANTNTETLTDYDGYSITIVSDDVACPTGPYQYHGTGTWHVLSGTGRYSGASGTGTFDGNSDFAAGTFTMSLSGTLVVPTGR